MENRYTDGTYLRENPGWHGEDAPWKLAHVLRALSQAGVLERVHRVCDVGCGSGDLLKTWARQRPDMHFTGCDISPQAHALCVKDAPSNVRFVHGSQTEGAPFDLVMAVDVLEHVPDMDPFLEFLHTQADLLLLHVPLDLSFRSVLKPEILEQERRTVGHLHFFTGPYLRRFLAQRNYEVLSWHYTNKYVERPPVLMSVRSKIGMWIRRLAHYGLPRAWAAWLVGGYSVMLVARLKK